MAEFKVNHRFDRSTCRHFLNDHCTVLHCHHFMTLYTQLAMDAKDFNGEYNLMAASEDTFYEVLEEYYKTNNIHSIEDKVSIAEQYWKASGMGLIRFTAVGEYEVLAEMEYSHVDEGFLKKWGTRESKPVNFVTAGFISAVSSHLTGTPARTFQTVELKSLIRGDEKSEFRASRK